MPRPRPKILHQHQKPSAASEILHGRLYLSGLEPAESPNILKRLGITHVVSVYHDDICYPKGLSGKLHLRLEDSPDTNLLEALESTTLFIRDAFKDPRSRVLVHCFKGISRSASVVVGFLIAEADMSMKQALAYVRQRRPYIRPNWGFMEQLEEYDRLISRERAGQRKLEWKG